MWHRPGWAGCWMNQSAMDSQNPQDTALHHDASLRSSAAERLQDSPPPSTDAADGPESEQERVRAVHAVIRQLLLEDLDAVWDEVLDTWSQGTPTERRAVRAYVTGLRNRVAQSLLDIRDMDELEYSIAIQYVELRCHWTMLNTRIQNQTADGQPDERLLYRATCVSQIIDALESLLPSASIDRLSEFVAEPLRHGAQADSA